MLIGGRGPLVTLGLAADTPACSIMEMVCLELFATSDLHLTFNTTHALLHLHTSRPLEHLTPRIHHSHTHTHTHTHMMIGQATGMLGEGEIASEE
jgi:hypothetical protein